MYCLSLLVFYHGFKFQKSICNGCHDLLIMCTNISDIALVTVKGVDYHCNIFDIRKSDTINLLENSVLDDIRYLYKMHFKEINIKNKSLQLLFWQFNQSTKNRSKKRFHQWEKL